MPHMRATQPCGRVAFLMPGVRARAVTTKPDVAALREGTLGAKLKRRRRERGLRQIDVAREMGVNQHSVIDWEKGKEPMVAQYPAIIAYLGYEPWSEPQSLGENLTAERRRRGLSIRQAAELLKIDEGTFGAWERGSRRPVRQSSEVIVSFLAASERPTLA